MITFGRITSNRHVELTLCTYPTVLRALPDFLTEQKKFFFSLTFFSAEKKDFLRLKVAINGLFDRKISPLMFVHKNITHRSVINHVENLTQRKDHPLKGGVRPCGNFLRLKNFKSLLREDVNRGK